MREAIIQKLKTHKFDTELNVTIGSINEVIGVIDEIPVEVGTRTTPFSTSYEIALDLIEEIQEDLTRPQTIKYKNYYFLLYRVKPYLLKYAKTVGPVQHRT